MPTPRGRTNDLSAFLLWVNDWHTTVRFTLSTHIIHIIQLDAQKSFLKYGSLDARAAINGITQCGIVTRPLLDSSGGEYCLNLSSVLPLRLFTSFHLKKIFMSFQCVQKLTYFLICSLYDLSKPKCSHFCYRADHTSKLSNQVSTSYQSVVRAYFGGAHYFGHVGCRVKCWLQKASDNRL